jgi:hypothetical protein
MIIYTINKMKKFLCLLLLLTSLFCQTTSKGTHFTKRSSYSQAPLISNTEVALGVVLLATAGYFSGRIGCWFIVHVAQKRYEPEFDLLARAAYNEQVVQEELIPYILEQYDLNNSLELVSSKYRGYPLLQYKHDLDWYINNLWTFRFFYLGTKKSDEITRLIERLKRIKRYIVTDYRYVLEQRQFERDNRNK